MKMFRRKGTDGQVPKEWVAALRRRFRDDRGPGREKDLVDYVLTGSPAQALTKPNPHGPRYGFGVERDDDLFTFLDKVPTEVALRFARAYAAEIPMYGGLRSPSLANAEWAHVLVCRFPPAAAPSVSIETLERMFVAAGLPSELVLTPAFSDIPAGTYNVDQYNVTICRTKGYAAAVQRHAGPVRAAIGAATSTGRLAATAMLANLPDDVLREFASEVADLSCTGGEKVRRQGERLVARLGAHAVQPVRSIAAEGAPPARLQAFRQLHLIGDDEIRAWAVEAAGRDRAASVRALIGEWEERVDDAVTEEPSPVTERPGIEWRVPVTADLQSALGSVHKSANEGIVKHNLSNRAHVERYRAQFGSVPDWLKDTPPLPSAWVASMTDALEAGRPPEVRKQSRGSRTELEIALEKHATELVGLGATGLLTLLARNGLLLWHSTVLAPDASMLLNRVHEVSGRPGLLELATALDQMGLPGVQMVLSAYAPSWGQPLGVEWPDEQVAPFVGANLNLVLEMLTSHDVQRAAAYRLLASLPAMPRNAVLELLGKAFGSSKNDRRPAQDALARVLGIANRVTQALGDGKGETRAVAAAWLQRLGHAEAVPALEAALKKEKQDLAAGAMLDALESFGQPVGKYLDRDGLQAQAEKLLAKGLPKDLMWFPVDAIPDVRWADTGKLIPRTVLTWFLAQAVKAKSPEPGAVLRKYAAMFEPSDRERFGQFVLESWIAQDLRPIDAVDAHQQAADHAQWVHDWNLRAPRDDDPLSGKSVAELTAYFLPGYLRRPRGSAASSKGLLAVAGACAGERAAATADRYLREWYGMRASQGKALIGMLAWVDHPSATQLMLSIGSRFRTKSFQEEATRQAEALAERRGWTVAELADRTIPTGGFDETGTLELSYGERVFTARLMPDLSVVLRDPDGKPIKSLPPPRKTDDEDRAKESKRTYQAAKKELKAVATLQTARLYEALCTERSWPYDDWSRYLNRHPVLRHSTQRLAWLAIAGDGARQVFRPLDDGTLTDVDDNEVTVADDARVAVAHDSNLTPEQIAAWAEHFEDYEVTPLFQQFGKGRFELSEERRREKSVEEFRGHLVETFALRSRAAKLGYTRGPAEDGGWFMTYVKRFPTLGVEAIVEFTGNPLPEANRIVALLNLSFAKVGERGRSVLRLGDVPAVLLSECYHDQRLMAADGPGFDPEWEKKSEYR